MKRQLNYRVFSYFFIFILIAVLIFSVTNYRTFKSTLLLKNEHDVKNNAAIFEQSLRISITDFENKINYLGKDLVYENDRPIYIIGEFARSIKGIESIYIYDKTREIQGRFSENSRYEELIGKQLIDLYFYEPIIWEEIDEGTYIIYSKVTFVKEMYVTLVVNINEYFSEFEENKIDNVRIINSFGKVVAKTLNGSKEDINSKEYKDELLNGYVRTEYADGEFVSYRPFDINNLDLFIIYSHSDQEYSGTVRLYLVKVVGISLFLFTFGFLIAWRLIKKIYDSFVITILNEKYNDHEFKKIHKEIYKAIEWIEEVVLHYDELNELKEELIELNTRLPKEGEKYDKTAILKKIKGRFQGKK